MTTEREQILALAGEPVAWKADVATYLGLEDRYSGWETRITNFKPQCPLGSIKHVTGLYTSDQLLAARKPLEDDNERLKVAADKYNKILHITERGCYQLMYWDTDRDEWQKVSVEEGINHGS